MTTMGYLKAGGACVLAIRASATNSGSAVVSLAWEARGDNPVFGERLVVLPSGRVSWSAEVPPAADYDGLRITTSLGPDGSLELAMSQDGDVWSGTVHGSDLLRFGILGGGGA